MSDILDGAGAPRHHGFAQCSRCGTQRPAAQLLSDDMPGLTPLGVRCRDRVWCDRQSGKPTGLDQHGDAQ